MSIRQASHAGSWYSDSGSELNSQLSDWLSKASFSHGPARAIIAPHAGYSYSGPCSAFAYKQIDPSKVKRVFILGPSHHVRLNGCSLTRCETYETPLYNLTVDQTINKELEATGSFEKMSMSTDEDEHSIELHLPYVAKAMESRKDSFTIVPVLIGSINAEKESHYGRIFSKYLSDPENFFVISSDFCHWGQRFHYNHYEKEHGEIWQSIENLDRRGMALIEALDPRAFNDYLKAHQNTICGRHPIGVFLNAVDCLNKNGFKDKFTLKFVQYAQSNRCKSMRDSSVSYASASLVVLP